MSDMDIKELNNVLETANIPYQEWKDGLLDQLLEKINSGKYSLQTLSEGRKIELHTTTVVIMLYYHQGPIDFVLVKDHEKSPSGEISRDGAHEHISFLSDNSDDEYGVAKKLLKSLGIGTIVRLTVVEKDSDMFVRSNFPGIDMLDNQTVLEATINVSSYKPLGYVLPVGEEGGYIRYIWESLSG